MPDLVGPSTSIRRRATAPPDLLRTVTAVTYEEQAQAHQNDPRHTFLTSQEVLDRYRWKRTKGYEMLRSPGFPRPVANRYRLDSLLAWEDALLAGTTSPQSSATQHRTEPVRTPRAAIEPLPFPAKPTKPRNGVLVTDNILATGTDRSLGGGQRPWATKLYAPSTGRGAHRVRFKEPDEAGIWDWSDRGAATEAAARTLFAQVETALDSRRAVPVKAREAAGRTLETLGKLYLAESRKDGKAVRTIEGRESKMRAHINPVAGAVPVSRWDLQLTRDIINQATATVHSAAGLSDIRSVLSAMRTLAWRQGWLERSIDPLDGLRMPRAEGGDGTGYVPPQQRPATHQVDAMAAAADHLTTQGPEQLRRLPLFGLEIRVAGYGGLRLGEQNGLRAVDFDFEHGLVDVNGSWTQPRAKDSPPFRGPVKNRRRHDVPLPASILAALQPRVAVLLGLAEDASTQQVINAVNAERARRGRKAGKPQLWWKLPVDKEAESWIFIDSWTGLPARSELHNSRWHKVRRWVDENDAEHAWPQHIVYRNLRHHAVTFWSEVLERPWVGVAANLGDTVAVTLAHYVMPGAEALSEMADQLKRY